MSKLPIPSATALKHSQTLTTVIARAISAAGGFISFARYMEMALYEPGLGYYSAGSHKIGKGGDFFTAPEITALFAYCVANQCREIMLHLGGGDILEIGAGSGKFAADILQQLERLDALPAHYYILDISADLRARQNHYLATACQHLLSRVIWLDSLPAEEFKGIVFANEVLDAMPVNCFHIDAHKIKERCVTFSNGELSWLSAPSTTHALQDAVAKLQETYALPNGYESEVNLQLPGWIASLSTILRQGVFLIFDYGYGEREFYLPERSMGTLMCYYQQQRVYDPFRYPGLQDITSHVNFTALAEAADAAGLGIHGYTTQASFLLACGIIELANEEKLPELDEYRQNQAIKILTLPSQMGELVKVMALTKNYSEPLVGFELYDRRHDL
jgi:SAM-dependent MidA family methyltransferase